MAHNLARWTARIGLGEQLVTTKTLRRRFFSLARRLIRSARRLTLHLPERWPWAEKFSRALARRQAIPSPACRHPSATDPPANRTSPQTRASPVCECPLLRPIPPSHPARRLQTAFKIPSGDCGRSRITVLLGCRPDNRARSPQPLRSVCRITLVRWIRVYLQIHSSSRHCCTHLLYNHRASALIPSE